jgi:hypothetical protein
MKYVIIAILLAFSASCAPKDTHVSDKVPDGYEHLEKRVKADEAAKMIRIGQTGAVFYYDTKSWSVKSESDAVIDFSARRFTNAAIFIYDAAMPMNDIPKKLAQHYAMKEPRLMESEFVNVNNAVVMHTVMEGIINRREVSIISYGFSENSHTVIAHCFIYTSMLRNETRQEIMEFLNGLVATI